VDDNDSLQRIPMARLDRLLHFDRRESLQQYAGKRVRCAMVFLEVAGRQVLSIRNADYFLLPFDDKGRIEKKEWRKIHGRKNTPQIGESLEIEVSDGKEE